MADASPPTWFEIFIPTTVAAADDVAGAAVLDVSAAKSGTEVRRGEVVFWVDAAEVESAVDQTREAARSWVERGLGVSIDEIGFRPAVPESEWRNAWKRFFKTIRLTRQVVVVPSWDEPGETSEEDILLHLDPGQAFGTGSHNTTRLMLRAMQSLCDEGALAERIADIGCGSGILSLAGARFWPDAELMAADIDPLSVSATKENCERNGVNAVVCQGSAERMKGRYSMVLANIQAHILCDLAAPLSEGVANDGYLLLSGILNPQAQSVIDAFSAQALTLLDKTQDGDWTCLVLRR